MGRAPDRPALAEVVGRLPVGLLGTLEVIGDDGRPVEIGGPQPRVVLVLLIAEAGRVVATDTLLEAVWGDEPPASAAGTLQSYVSRLRRVLGAVGATIEREPAGYRLVIEPAQLDVHRFESLADEGRGALDSGDPETARTLLLQAAELWRGPALLEVRDRLQASGLARRLDERRLAAVEDRLTADLQLGRHAAVVGELAQLVTDHPLREGLWALLATARYRAGQQADALRAIADARTTLVEELGVEPGPRLREIEAAILAQDQALDAAPRPAPVHTAPPATSAGPAVAEGAPMVGRDDELATLVEALDEARAGRPCVAVVQGEAGVGKTRLVEELAHAAARAGADVVWGRSMEGAAAPAYWPWLGVLRPLREDERSDVDPSVAHLLDATGEISAVVGAAEGQVLQGVLRLLASTGRGRTVVAVFEDIQWAGDESLELLAHVVSGLDHGSVLLVLTLREGQDATQVAVVDALAAASRRPTTRRLRLTGLQRDETAELLAQVHGRPVEGSVAQVVHERAGGNPFYAIELARLLRSEGMIDDASLARRAVPVGVRDVVRQRLARLPSPTVELLQLAAVAGRDIDLELLGRASGRSIEQCLDDLDVALRHQLLVEADSLGVLRFSHALVREVVFDDLSALRRARIHLVVADTIEALDRGGDVAEIVAEHLWAAAPIGAGRRAADALDRAAELVIRRFAVRAAADLLQRSLQLRQAAGSSTDEDASAELATIRKLVWALWTLHGYPGGLAHYGRGAELADRLDRQDVALEMRWLEWAAYDTSCQFELARPLAERFRDLALESDDPLVQMHGFQAWGIQRWHDGVFDEAYDFVSRAFTLRWQVPVVKDDLSGIAELIVLNAAFRLNLGEQVGALTDVDDEYEELARSGPRDFAQAIAWTFACNSAASLGDLPRIERYARRVLDAEAGEVLGFWGSQARMFLGGALVATDRAEEGRRLFDAGLDGYRVAGIRTGAALMLAVAASAEVIAGDLERARMLVDAALADTDRGERYALPAAWLAAADIAEATGAPAEGVRRRREEAEALAREQCQVGTAARARAALDGERWLQRPAQHPPASGSSTTSPREA